MLNRGRHKGLLLSLAGNLLLAGILVLLWTTGGQTVAGGEMSKVPVTSLPASMAGFDWPAVRSSDYLVYAQNLRALGCPEASIVDLIVGEVSASYAARMRAEAAVPERNYWEAPTIMPAAQTTRIAEVRSRLERERREVLVRALGPQALQTMSKYRLWNDVDQKEELLAFLPADKRQQLQAIAGKYAQLDPENMALLSEEAMRRLTASQAQQRAEIAALLSAKELEDLDLRTSETAERLRQELRGFEASESEFRQLFRVRQAYENTLATNTNVRDPNVLQVRAEAERRFAEEARAAVGDARYADYERARDQDFQNVLQLTQFYDLPVDLATRIFDLKRDVAARANGITSNAGLSEARREELLTQVQGDTERSLQGLLGSEVLAEYRRSNRWWIFNE
jgi:hypothetical protein